MSWYSPSRAIYYSGCEPMQWISVEDRKPTPEDSPILVIESLNYFSISALHYIDGWNGSGWYEANDEYGMGLNEDEAHFHEHGGMIYWMPLPAPPSKV